MESIRIFFIMARLVRPASSTRMYCACAHLALELLDEGLQPLGVNLDAHRSKRVGNVLSSRGSIPPEDKHEVASKMTHLQRFL